jgi:hypothetical protein
VKFLSLSTQSRRPSIAASLALATLLSVTTLSANAESSSGSASAVSELGFGFQQDAPYPGYPPGDDRGGYYPGRDGGRYPQPGYPQPGRYPDPGRNPGPGRYPGDGRYPPPQDQGQVRVVECSSAQYRTAVCDTGFWDISGVRLIQQYSSASCQRGSTYGNAGRGQIYVTQGCRGRFAVRGR